MRPLFARLARVATFLLVVVFAALGASSAAQAQDGGGAVEILQLTGTLDPPVAAEIRELLRDANERGSELVVLQVDLPTAIAVSPETVTEPILRSAVPVVVWVGAGGARAGGAGALLAASGHVLAVAPGASVGPACPLVASASCRDAAERRAVTELLAGTNLPEAAVAALTTEAVGAERAVDLGIAALSSSGLTSLLVDLDGREVATAAGPRTLEVRSDEVTVRLHSMGLLRRVQHATLHPTLIYLVLVTILLLLLFEVFQPGFGVAGFAALLLLPLAVYGLVVMPVAWWAVAVVVVGMVLLALDLAIAGLGIPTLLGAAGVAAGSWWLFPAGQGALRLSPWLIGTVTAACVVFFVLVMTVVLRAQAGPEVGAMGQELAGRVGVVRSVLNPEGHVFVAGALWRARWTSETRGRLRTGTQVRIHGMDEEGVLLVEEVERESGTAAERS